MTNEPVNLEFVIKAINEAKAGVDSAVSDFKRLSGAAVDSGKATSKAVSPQAVQNASALHNRITQLTGSFRKLGIELETIDLYFISGFKVVGLFKLLEFAKQSVLSFENVRKAMLGVQLASEQSGHTMEESLTSMNKLLAMGKLGTEDLAEAMRNLLKKGYAPSQAEFIVESLIKSGTVFGTQGGMPLAQAVRRATEGILQDLSTLTDATRLTQNLDKMWANYARTIGKTAKELDEYEKRQAVIAYFLKENTGLTEKYSEANTGLTKAIGEFTVQWDRLKRDTGKGLSIPVTWAVKGGATLIDGFMKDLDLLTSVIQAQNIALSIPVEFVFATGAGLVKGWGSELFKSFQEVRLNPHDIKDNPISQAFDSAKGKLSELSYAVDDFYATTFGRNSAIYKLLGMGKTDLIFNPAITRSTESMLSGGERLQQHLGVSPWWNKPEEGATVDFGKMIDKAKLEEMRRLGERMANSFSYAFERGISDVFFNLFTGEKSSFIDMARNFGKSLARAISDAMAEAMIAPVKSWMSGLFSGLLSAGGAAAGAGMGASVGSAAGGGMLPSGGLMAPLGAKGITVNVGNGLTPKEIGSMVTRELTDSYSRNSSVRKVIKGQR